MKYKQYTIYNVIDLMANGLLTGQDARKAIAQASYNHRKEIIENINSEAIADGANADELLPLPTPPESFEIDLEASLHFSFTSLGSDILTASEIDELLAGLP